MPDRFKIRTIRLLLLPALMAPGAGFPDPTDTASLLARFRRTDAIEYRYEETRNLDLMAAPWKGKGYLLAGADGTLIKLQLSPERIVMAVSGERMAYHDLAHGQRQSAPLSQAGSLAQQIGAFRAILQGRAEALPAGYVIRTESQNGHWKLHLTGQPGKPGESAPTLEISGDETRRRRHLLIRQADGDITEYTLEKAAEGQHLESWIKSLIAEAMGE